MSNYEFLKSLLTTIPEDARNISLMGYFALIVISIIAALMISYLYSKFFDANSTGSRIHRSFPLLGPAITTIFLTVQYSLPLSLGLLGALSIVRFRTPIKEPEEIGFILLVIACSISIATFNVAFAALLYIAVFIVLHGMRKFYSAGTADGGAVILNIAASREQASEGAGLIESVCNSLDSKEVKYRVASIHNGEGGINASLLLKSRKQGHFNVVKQLTEEFPDLTLDYYQR